MHPRSYRNHVLNGLKLIPPQLVPLVRPLFTSQGISARTLKDNGEIDELELLALGFDTIEIRTAYTPVTRMPVAGPIDPKTEAALQDVKPSLTFTGRAGRVTIAPYGTPTEFSSRIKEWGVKGGLIAGGVVLTLLGLGVVAGRATSK